MNISLFDSLLINRLPGVGAAAWSDLLEKFPSVQRLLDAKVANLPIGAEAKAILLSYQQQGEDSDIAQAIKSELTWCEKHNVKVLSLHDERYPKLLKHIHRPPPILYVSGNLNQLHKPQIAVVGSRKPSPGGLDNAFAFGRFLASSGFAITSGLALGIDGAAHEGALKANGATIAVLGCGIDKIYPRRHQPLAREILEKGGAIVSEFPIGTEPGPERFPQRNRIISGLSLGVLVVEGAIKSGSLITARESMKQGREVFTIPGSIHNPLSKGCHKLLKEGATLVESGQDLVNELQGLIAFKAEELGLTVMEGNQREGQKSKGQDQKEGRQYSLLSEAVPERKNRSGRDILNTEERRLLANIGYDPESMDTLLRRSQLSASQLGVHLMNLELKSYIRQTAYGYERLRL